MNNQNYNGYNQQYNQNQQSYQRPQQPQYNQYQQGGYQQFQPQMNPSNQDTNQTGHGANMIQAIKLFFTHYVDFTSKSTRSEWWWMKLWELIYGFVATLLLLITGASSIVSAITQSGIKGASFLGALDSFGFIGILVIIINTGISIPFLALRTRRFSDAGLPFGVALGINIARVACFWLADVFAPIGFIFMILIIASFIIELLPTKANNTPINNMPPYNNYNQSNMNTQNNQYQQNGYQQPNQSYQQPQYNQYQ